MRAATLNPTLCSPRAPSGDTCTMALSLASCPGASIAVNSSGSTVRGVSAPCCMAVTQAPGMESHSLQRHCIRGPPDAHGRAMRPKSAEPMRARARCLGGACEASRRPCASQGVAVRLQCVNKRHRACQVRPRSSGCCLGAPGTRRCRCCGRPSGTAFTVSAVVKATETALRAGKCFFSGRQAGGRGARVARASAP